MNSIQDGSPKGVDMRRIKHNDSIAFAILDLPIGSIINIDGVTVVLQRNDFVGIHSIPTKTTVLNSDNTENDSVFHLVTIRGGALKAKTSLGASQTSTITVGFLMFSLGMENPIVARQYDPQTEEVSSSPLEEVTMNNLIEQVNNNKIEPQRILSYGVIISTEAEDFWYDLTNFITERFLKKFRKLKHGSKIVPGTYESGDDINDVVDTHEISVYVDGIPITYPPIPLFAQIRPIKNFQSDLKGVSVCQHFGTRRFLQALSPPMRTSLCFSTNGENCATMALDYIIETAYQQHWEYLLGDVQLSFVLFMHLHCYTSYTYWRDIISMLSAVNSTTMKQHVKMYSALFLTLSKQVQSIDEDEGVFADIDLSDDEFFLFPSLHKLIDTGNDLSANINLDSLTTSLLGLKSALKMKFSSKFGEVDVVASVTTTEKNLDLHQTDSDHVHDHGDVDFNDDDDDDDDSPQIVSMEEIQESQTRIQQYMMELNQYVQVNSETAIAIDKVDRHLLQQSYPLLLAAMDSSGGKEDIMMTCARVLYDAVDVSLVREAAAYLEDIEVQASKAGNM